MIVLHDEIATALLAGTPIVALESAVITAGLPREPIASWPSQLCIDGWRADQPANLELARAMERAVRDGGAVPATIAILDGKVRIGLGDADLERLALDARAGKAAITDLAHALSQTNLTAGTTVSGTLAALQAARERMKAWLPFSSVTSSASSPAASPPVSLSPAHLRPISVFATGGIGGVHRDWQKCPDVSADLRAIASTPACIVCSGGKSILDLPATLEALEALNVPVLGYRTHLFPQFQSLGTTDLRLRLKIDDAREAASVCMTHWTTLLQTTGVLLANPVPREFAVDAVEMALAVEAAERDARKRGVIGALRTPFLLNEIARLTHNRSLEANIALLLGNARLAAEVAAAIVVESQGFARSAP